ncbi:hypothetical protein EWB00_006017 [Schistosoma japonicum]|uniref:Uncharacterized protein n=1 Tax=Schistosoma japonicum TaxID=6182 RepID=A0A4Z2DTM6_SCHJA|nr:hypothetical protein EWB00_006017 [Schistosoma japonicum]
MFSDELVRSYGLHQQKNQLPLHHTSLLSSLGDYLALLVTIYENLLQNPQQGMPQINTCTNKPISLFDELKMFHLSYGLTKKTATIE